MSNRYSSHRPARHLQLDENGPARGPLAQKAMNHVPTAAAERHPGAGPHVRRFSPERGSRLLPGPTRLPVDRRHQPRVSGAPHPHTGRASSQAVRNQAVTDRGGRRSLNAPGRPARQSGWPVSPISPPELSRERRYRSATTTSEPSTSCSALIREVEDLAAQVLVKLGGDLNRVRQQVIQLLDGDRSKG